MFPSIDSSTIYVAIILRIQQIYAVWEAVPTLHYRTARMASTIALMQRGVPNVDVTDLYELKIGLSNVDFQGLLSTVLAVIETAALQEMVTAVFWYMTVR